jgi:hypothetical protein
MAALALPTSILASPKVLGLEFSKQELWGGQEPGLRRRASDNTQVYNAQASLLYLVNVTVGTPGQKMSLQLDTGSSDIWIPWANSAPCSTSENRCKTNGLYSESKSSTYSLLQSNSFLISYVDGTRIKGDYISDVFGVGSASIKNMTMGLAKSATENSNVGDFQGIIGVGYETSEAVYAQTGQTYQNLPSLMKAQGVTNTRAYSLWLNDKGMLFVISNSYTDANDLTDNGRGTILFGGVDTEKFKAPLVSLPIQPDARSGTIISFTVALDSVNVIGADSANQYARPSLAMPVILDSGTTLTYLPDAIANDIYIGVGAVQSNTYGVVVPCDLANSPATFNFGFGNSNGPVIVAAISQFVLPFPDSFPTPTFRSTGKKACRWGIQASGSRPNLFGDTFLRAAYVVYNLDNDEVGIANAVLNSTKSNIQEITNSKQIPGVSSTASGIVAKQTASGLYGPNSYTFSSGSGQIGTASGTFNLGPTDKPQSGTSSSTSGGAGNKGAASSLNAPRLPVVAAVASFVSVLMVAGGAMVFSMQHV